MPEGIVPKTDSKHQAIATVLASLIAEREKLVIAMGKYTQDWYIPESLKTQLKALNKQIDTLLEKLS